MIYHITLSTVQARTTGSAHDDVIKWKHFPRNWPFVRGIHQSLVNSPHKGQWRGALMFSLICAWTSDWVNNDKAGDLRRHNAHYDVIVMKKRMFLIIDIDVILQSLRIKYSWLRKYFLAYTYHYFKLCCKYVLLICIRNWWNISNLAKCIV